MIAIVFDNAGTITKIYRAIKDVKKGEFICNKQSVDLVDEKKGRALVIIKDDPLKTVDRENPNNLISNFLRKVNIGVSYCNKPIKLSGIFEDKKTRVRELQEPLNILKSKCSTNLFGSAVIIDTLKGEVDYTVATSGCLFPEVEETFKKLKELGVKIYIASGDRKGFLEELAKKLKVDNIVPEAHQEKKKELIRRLKEEGYFTIMVGDGANDVPAMLESDLAIVTLQNKHPSEKALEVADYKIKNIKEVIDIVKKYINQK
ncbi:HAD family hydrolase [Methanocaldococcus infernus]